jgi:AmpD protein
MAPVAPRFGWQIDADGWCAGQGPFPLHHCRSPNYDARPAAVTVDLLVVHNISLPPGQFGGPYIEDLFCNRIELAAHESFASLQGLTVSSHFLIRRDGSVLQFVATGARAWHAGVSEFAGRSRCNDFSIGIELEGSDFVPFEAAQYNALVHLTDALRQAHPLVAVRGHQHIAPGRKTDPGPHFDWGRYQEACRKWLAGAGLSFP